ncbi:uncharacterized protein [Lolium perenne]|uniref:uncharacterized protein isoform X2 n=1 Tax=Lolium perenne TaxID=4522 RepID=UPI003A99DA0B
MDVYSDIKARCQFEVFRPLNMSASNGKWINGLQFSSLFWCWYKQVPYWHNPCPMLSALVSSHVAESNARRISSGSETITWRMIYGMNDSFGCLYFKMNRAPTTGQLHRLVSGNQ